ncbi:threonine/homoserine/homoserine lactone efflux protein [Vibrio crassostreae]|uniref:LysE family translocator n=1 Tax=Vibrio crassostreae TaxID=246167 RepID=UPI000F485C7C|nr:LysE family translocator [Vibrio crassostreae]ROO76266.1 threonine/homoserine/homoserine lactone efflux protein [Vibrio crassostreae]ROP14276.1 threonine/homoserine/homoserine lactone efflux protein [Vibrio crassostreae]ROQ88362.1 threonine/homoserine/homoserine lactone efflux protein [Vibrio crassostreae]ROR87289.1 threonine/homoserine/homoserine lactone efflux protein [Vibrio crassostreae]RPE94489.1 threonine/homoserine/homoserine lactone efflux protein [Vibrio crassostreae]
MEIWKLLLFIPACFALNMTPGPNNLLSMNNARCYGFQAAFVAGLGRILAFSGMIALAASGLAVVLYTSETLFFLIKLFGAMYLLWIAFNLWRSQASPVADIERNKNWFGLVKQEFALAAGNPKAILIFTAFLPQFVDVSSNVNTQFFILGSIFLVLELLAISIYAAFGLYLRNWFSKPQMAKRFNKACSVFLALSGANLLVSRQ